MRRDGSDDRSRNNLGTESLQHLWTPITLSHPEKGQKVIAWSPSGINQVKDCMCETLFDGHDFVHDLLHGISLNGVTHWMPFPEPPYE